MKITKPVPPYTVSMGCDPEFFFKEGGKILGSEKIIDIKDGFRSGPSKFIVDGVQAELNPSPNSCRANLANEIHYCFINLKKKLKETGRAVTTSFTPLAEVSETELNSLDPSSRVFGCAPSMNTNPESRGSATLVDPSKYRFRSAGGHIHLGDPRIDTRMSTALRSPDLLIPVMDILVGNTCVLIDRDEGNIERRKVYGRAGEYRTPAHGIEYRTLSNFWLRAYPLMSFVMSMSRFSAEVVAHSYQDDLMALVDMVDIHKAINENDFDLAMTNYLKVKPFIVAAAEPAGDHHPLTSKNIEDFEYFVVKGVDYWFKQDPLEHWASLPECHNGGWEDFLRLTVRPKRLALNRAAAKEEKPRPSAAEAMEGMAIFTEKVTKKVITDKLKGVTLKTKVAS